MAHGGGSPGTSMEAAGSIREPETSHGCQHGVIRSEARLLAGEGGPGRTSTQHIKP